MSDRRVDAWERQRRLARTTVGWAGASIAAGLVLGARRDPWWRSFGRQHLGWGVVDLGIVAVLDVVQRRRMGRLPDPYDPSVLERERRRVRTVLGVNAVADVGYAVAGVMLWRRSTRPQAAGAGAAIAIQGAFLAGHDAYHAAASTPQPVTPQPVTPQPDTPQPGTVGRAL